ncbi:MAG: ribonuclease HII [Candidatus Amoebophilus sp.]
MFTKETFNQLVAGCDEVGRGCLAGPVVAAAVILPSKPYYFLLKDSKKLTAKQRIELAAIIKEEAIDWSIGCATPEEIDQINISNASHLAMHRAINKLIVKPGLLLIDGNKFLPYPDTRHECIVKGDEKVNSIAAASIIAKVYRDQYMQELSEREPGYNWEINMGYPTKDHYQSVYELGMSFHHRRSFSLEAKHLQPSLWTS